MTIKIKPEQEWVIGQAIEAGLIETADQAFEIGVESIRQRLEDSKQASESTAGNLAKLFTNSPFAGLNIDFERDEDLGRNIELGRLPAFPKCGPQPSSTISLC